MWGIKESEESNIKPRLWACLTGERNVQEYECAGRGGVGWTNQEFGLGHVAFQMAMKFPSKIYQTNRDAGLGGRGEFWRGEIQFECRQHRGDIKNYGI